MALERFHEDEVKLRYQNALKAEVHGFSGSVKSKLERDMNYLMEWEDIVNRVAESEVGEKSDSVVERLDGGIMKLRKKLV